LIAYLAIGLAAVASVPAQDTRAGTAIGAEARPALQGPGSNRRVSVAAPIGKVRLSPRLVDGEPIYVRRTTAPGGMAIVEVSTTPFMPVASASDPPAVAAKASSQPAGW